MPMLRATLKTSAADRACLCIQLTVEFAPISLVAFWVVFDDGSGAEVGALRTIFLEGSRFELAIKDSSMSSDTPRGRADAGSVAWFRSVLNSLSLKTTCSPSNLVCVLALEAMKFPFEDTNNEVASDAPVFTASCMSAISPYRTTR
eukprot:CAMPEP_0169165872 /NCGR_PEP_ID=MMETSP1015-20121227/59648_1 /TAXON_ID=342587 /ORGANISM="Karlodinium micrum, Strain CCMP2283" /LENGTH=145 /DNA_ID=CAMNT_0009238501 /DNA_START=154 /DNA_END=591 /DNA_ORIENTATION=+